MYTYANGVIHKGTWDRGVKENRLSIRLGNVARGTGASTTTASNLSQTTTNNTSSTKSSSTTINAPDNNNSDTSPNNTNTHTNSNNSSQLADITSSSPTSENANNTNSTTTNNNNNTNNTSFNNTSTPTSENPVGDEGHEEEHYQGKLDHYDGTLSLSHLCLYQSLSFSLTLSLSHSLHTLYTIVIFRKRADIQLKCTE